jgi:hypothetical protein
MSSRLGRLTKGLSSLHPVDLNLEQPGHQAHPETVFETGRWAGRSWFRLEDSARLALNYHPAYQRPGTDRTEKTCRGIASTPAFSFTFSGQYLITL